MVKSNKKIHMANKKKILFLYYDPHYAHAAMAKAIKADFYPAPKLKSDEKGIIGFIEGIFQIINAVITLPKNYDIYFCENTYIIPGIAKKIGLIKGRIINIFASPLLYYIKTGRIKGISKKLALSTLDEVDTALCIGKMEEKILRELKPNMKSIVIYPFIKDNIYKKLLNVKSSLNSHKIITIGTHDAYYKGIDIIVDAFMHIKKQFNDAELTIVGDMPNIKEIYGKEKGIKIIGKVDNIEDYLKESALYVHMGRGDTFPVSSLEAMLAGLPVIVSEWTGTKEVVEKVDKNYIIPLNSKKLANAIVAHFNKEQKQKTALSIKFRKIAIVFSKINIIKNIKINFD